MEPSVTLQLPNSIVSPIDVARLLRELDGIETFFQQQAVRQAGQSNAMPRLSRLLDELAAQNKLNLLQPSDRVSMNGFLKQLAEHAPVMHVSFSSDPPGQYVQKIVAHIRKHIHAQTLVTVGLQPNIGAGCIVRTTNKIFDLSLREYFKEKRAVFLDRLHRVVATEEPQSKAPATTQTEGATNEAAAHAQTASDQAATQPVRIVVSTAEEAPTEQRPAEVSQ